MHRLSPDKMFEMAAPAPPPEADDADPAAKASPVNAADAAYMRDIVTRDLANILGELITPEILASRVQTALNAAIKGRKITDARIAGLNWKGFYQQVWNKDTNIQGAFKQFQRKVADALQAQVKTAMQAQPPQGSAAKAQQVSAVTKAVAATQAPA